MNQIMNDYPVASFIAICALVLAINEASILLARRKEKKRAIQ